MTFEQRFETRAETLVAISDLNDEIGSLIEIREPINMQLEHCKNELIMRQAELEVCHGGGKAVD